MHVLVIGAAGMIGRKLSKELTFRRLIGEEPIALVTLVDVVKPSVDGEISGIEIQARTIDITNPARIRQLLSGRPDVIFHLAAIVSGEAEADLDKGYRINLDGTRYLFEAIRDEGLRQPYLPRVVYSSSLAVFGAPFPDKIDDDFMQTPLTSYGTQKLMGELMLSDYSRRGLLDGIGLRLPTICIRPGAPNKAASGFYSSILREPLVGKEAILPVGDDVRHWFASPRAAVGFLLHAAELDTKLLGARRNINLPGLSGTVGDQIEALRRVAGDQAVKLIKREKDDAVLRVVSGWPRDFDAKRAIKLGFKAETSFDDIIKIHVEDELGGKLGG